MSYAGPSRLGNPMTRRNGMWQSCDPCRKRKLKCDHCVPCSRCAHRGVTEQCIYSPSHADTSLTNSTHVRASRRSSQMAGSLALTASPPRAAPLHESSPAAQASTQGSTQSLTSVSSVHSPTGFLGSSSHFAVVQEIDAILGLDEGHYPLRHENHERQRSDDEIHGGAQILFYLKELDAIDRLLQRWLAIGDGYLIFRPVYRVWVETLVTSLGPFLSSASTAKDLHTLSRTVWRNTQVPMSVSAKTTVRDWALQSTGHCLRWETVGLLFSAIGLMIGSIRSCDAVFASLGAAMADKFALVKTMLELVNCCIGFARECGSVNDLFALLLYESALLLERTKGSASYDAWLRMSEVANTAVVLGLHQEKKIGDTTPFFLCELRIRFVDQIYSHDKFLATYLGRPPHISFRHCAIQLPRELSDDDACLEGAALDEALQRLENGDNEPKRLHRSSWRRAWSQHAHIRELILELAIGSSIGDIDGRVHDIRNRIQVANEEMPSFVKTDPEQLLDDMQQTFVKAVPGYNATWSPINTMYLLLIHCGMRHTDFLLERAVVYRQKLNGKQLVPYARNLLRLVLQIVAKKDYLCDFQVDIISILAFYAVPSAGLLAIELLKQENWSDDSEAEILPRSETIQQLSTTVWALRAVGPGEGNFAICAIGMKALRRVLDRVLASTANQTGTTLPAGTEPSLFDDYSMYFPGANDAEFMELLAGDWLEKL